MTYPLKKHNPDAEFIAASEKAICPNMKMITLEKVLWSLEDMQHEIVVPKEIATKAKTAIDRMVEILPVR
jgi:quinolinate synthase